MKFLLGNNNFKDNNSFFLSKTNFGSIPKFKFLNIKNLDKKADDKLNRRGLLNLNYAYLIDTYKDQKDLYKKFYLAAKKVNEFSSIHFKISG